MENIKAGGMFSECHFIEFMACPVVAWVAAVSHPQAKRSGRPVPRPSTARIGH